MTRYTLTTIDGPPIVQTTIHADYSIANDFEQWMTETTAALAATAEPHFLLIDARAFEADGLQDVIWAANNVTRGDEALFDHPHLREVLAVVESSFLSAIAKGLTSDTFNNAPVRVFNDRESALAYAQTHIDEAVA